MNRVSILLTGILLGTLGSFAWLGLSGSAGSGQSDASGSAIETVLEKTGFLRRAHAALGEGDYEFFPNRRSVWVVNRTNGRMAMYEFRSDQAHTVDRSRVSQIDLQSFPREDTVIQLSDRNLSNILWVCNVRTGDVSMWRPTREGTLEMLGPVVTGAHLIDR